MRAQLLINQDKIIDKEKVKYKHLKSLKSAEQTTNYDVNYYRLELKVDPSVKHRLLDKYSRLVRQGKIEVYTKSQLEKSKKETFVRPIDQF